MDNEPIDELLDDRSLFENDNQLGKLIRWWERARLFYNFSLSIACFLAIVTNWHNAMNMGVKELGLFFLIFIK